nr:uncharacterized protein LOC112024991 [Quercus suber]
MSDVLYKGTKYMNAEDALLAREEKPKKRERQEDTRQERGRKMARTGERRDDRHSKPPAGRFTSFTPLTTSIDQVLMQIKYEGALTLPGKLKGDPNKRFKDKYCCFHRDHALIRQEKLQKFVSKERADSLPQEQAPRQDNERPRQPLGDIRMIVGGIAANSLSKKARKTYLRMVQNVQLTSVIPKIPRVDNPIIGFSKEDARRHYHLHDDAFVISIQVGDYNTYRVLIDNGSSADILYYLAFQQMQISRE